MTTKEKYSTTATVTVNVLDGDDQYPQFQPCAPVYEDGDHNICTNPVYSVNITETDEVCVCGVSVQIRGFSDHYNIRKLSWA